MTFTDQLLEMGDLTNVFTTVDVITVLIISTILCFIVAQVYQKVHSGISYSYDFVQTIVMFGVLVSMIMLIIGSNIARAFTLVGALSIIRFRNAVKDTKDVGFIFFMMTIGMAVGTRFYGLAIIMTLFVSVLLLGMYITGYGRRTETDEMVKVTVPDTSDYEKKVELVLKEYVKHTKLINVEGTKDGMSELVYMVRFKKGVSASTKKKLIEKLKELNRDLPVYIFGAEHLLY